MNKIIILICLALLSACSELSQKHDDAKELVLKKLFSQEQSINPPERSTYPPIQKLPGTVFVARQAIRSSFTYDSEGRLILLLGDYVFPVITYCMNSSLSSPSGHRYTLSKMEGKRAKIIRELNLLAPAKYNTKQIQMVSWALQNGLSYEELGTLGQKMIDHVLPHYESELSESFLTKLGPHWDEASDLLDDLDDFGNRIKQMKEFRDRLLEVGYDYEELRKMIDTSTRSQVTEDTPWSQISNNVYARFITEGSFGEIGYLEVRVVSSESGRAINSINAKTEIFDIASLLANPNSNGIQPLSFSPLYGVAGTVTLSPAISSYPLAGALLIAAVLSAKFIDWDSFFELQKLFQNTFDRDVKQEIKRGLQALSKEHDKLEKPLKDVGIIPGKTKDTTKKKNGKVREYMKEGGDEALQKDFEKISGLPSKEKSGIEVKILPDRTTIVKRPKKDGKPATLEVQPPKGNSQYSNDKIRIKVRY